MLNAGACGLSPGASAEAYYPALSRKRPHMDVNLLYQAKPTTSLKNRRKRAGWKTVCLENLIRHTA